MGNYCSISQPDAFAVHFPQNRSHSEDVKKHRFARVIESQANKQYYLRGLGPDPYQNRVKNPKIRNQDGYISYTVSPQKRAQSQNGVRLFSSRAKTSNLPTRNDKKFMRANPGLVLHQGKNLNTDSPAKSEQTDSEYSQYSPIRAPIKPSKDSAVDRSQIPKINVFMAEEGNKSHQGPPFESKKHQINDQETDDALVSDAASELTSQLGKVSKSKLREKINNKDPIQELKVFSLQNPEGPQQYNEKVQTHTKDGLLVSTTDIPQVPIQKVLSSEEDEHLPTQEEHQKSQIRPYAQDTELMQGHLTNGSKPQPCVMDNQSKRSALKHTQQIDQASPDVDQLMQIQQAESHRTKPQEEQLQTNQTFQRKSQPFSRPQAHLEAKRPHSMSFTSLSQSSNERVSGEEGLDSFNLNLLRSNQSKGKQENGTFIFESAKDVKHVFLVPSESHKVETQGEDRKAFTPSSEQSLEQEESSNIDLMPNSSLRKKSKLNSSQPKRSSNTERSDTKQSNEAVDGEEGSKEQNNQVDKTKKSKKKTTKSQGLNKRASQPPTGRNKVQFAEDSMQKKPLHRNAHLAQVTKQHFSSEESNNDDSAISKDASPSVIAVAKPKNHLKPVYKIDGTEKDKGKQKGHQSLVLSENEQASPKNIPVTQALKKGLPQNNFIENRQERVRSKKHPHQTKNSVPASKKIDAHDDYQSGDDNGANLDLQHRHSIVEFNINDLRDEKRDINKKPPGTLKNPKIGQSLNMSTKGMKSSQAQGVSSRRSIKSAVLKPRAQPVKKKKQEDLEVSSDSSGNIDEEEGEAINKNQINSSNAKKSLNSFNLLEQPSERESKSSEDLTEQNPTDEGEIKNLSNTRLKPLSKTPLRNPHQSQLSFLTKNVLFKKGTRKQLSGLQATTSTPLRMSRSSLNKASRNKLSKAFGVSQNANKELSKRPSQKEKNSFVELNDSFKKNEQHISNNGALNLQEIKEEKGSNTARPMPKKTRNTLLKTPQLSNYSSKLASNRRTSKESAMLSARKYTSRFHQSTMNSSNTATPLKSFNQKHQYNSALTNASAQKSAKKVESLKRDPIKTALYQPFKPSAKPVSSYRKSFSSSKLKHTSAIKLLAKPQLVKSSNKKELKRFKSYSPKKVQISIKSIKVPTYKSPKAKLVPTKPSSTNNEPLCKRLLKPRAQSYKPQFTARPMTSRVSQLKPLRQNLSNTPSRDRTLKRVTLKPETNPQTNKGFLTDPKLMARPQILDRRFKTPAQILREQEGKSGEQPIAKRSRSQSQTDKSVLLKYFNEDEMQLFGKNDPVELQGDLYRFKPGIQHNFINRWVQISGKAFRYFRKQYDSMGLRRPIVAFPKKAIEDVCKIEVNKEAFMQKKHNNDEDKALFSHMFEIYLRQDYEDVYMYRDEEQKAMQEVRSRTQSRDNSPKGSKMNCSFMNSLSKQRFSSSNLMDQTIEGSKRREKTIYEKMIEKNKREQRESWQPSVSTFLTHSFGSKTNRIVQGHLMAVRDTDEGLQKISYLEDQDLILKDFGDRYKTLASNTVGNASAWTQRAVDWYNSERRIIFATKSEEERDKWISYFRQHAITKTRDEQDVIEFKNISINSSTSRE